MRILQYLAEHFCANPACGAYSYIVHGWMHPDHPAFNINLLEKKEGVVNYWFHQVASARHATSNPFSVLDNLFYHNFIALVMEELALKQPELIGREEELSKLKERLNNAIAGKGSAIFISGEAGIGKTRLVSEVRAPQG